MEDLLLGWLWFVSLILASDIARSKNQSQWVYLFLGLLFGPVALLAAVGTPVKEKVQ